MFEVSVAHECRVHTIVALFAGYFGLFRDKGRNVATNHLRPPQTTMVNISPTCISPTCNHASAQQSHTAHATRMTTTSQLINLLNL